MTSSASNGKYLDDRLCRVIGASMDFGASQSEHVSLVTTRWPDVHYFGYPASLSSTTSCTPSKASYSDFPQPALRFKQFSQHGASPLYRLFRDRDFQFLDKLFDKPDPDTATVRVAAGLDGHGLTQAQGSLSGVNVYNEFQHLIGSSGGGNIGSGGYYDFKVDQHNLQQATFVELLGSDGAVCIPYISVTWADGSKYGWVGDWGRNCGLDWYYSNVYVSNGPHRPACTWVDADHTNGIKAGSILIHMPSFSGNHQHSNNASSYCGYPAFRAYRDSDGTGSIFKRSESAPDRRHQKIAADSRLVVSDIPFHSAIDLCKASKSHGPDFVSTSEGVYCDMESREVMPVCRGDVKHNCFNLDHHVNEESRSSVADHSTRKSYSNVVKWDYGF